MNGFVRRMIRCALLDAQVSRLGIDRLLAPGASRRTEIFVAAD